MAVPAQRIKPDRDDRARGATGGEPVVRTPLTRRVMRFGGGPPAPWLLRAGLAIGGFMLVVALIAPLLALDPDATDLAARLQAPSAEHVLGTDSLGRDVLARVVAGFRWSLSIAAMATLIGLLIGTVLGVSAAWHSGKIRAVLTRAIDVGISFPYLVTALTFISVVGRGFWPLVLTLGLVNWPTIARVVYAQTLSLREREYVVAARLMGVRSLRSVLTHVLPALRPTALVVVAFMFAEMLVAESGLSFLGLGAPLGTPTWGNMLSESRAYLSVAPWQMIAPAVAIVLAVLAANFVGDGLTSRSHLRNERGGT